MKYIIRVKVYNESESKIISDTSFITKDKNLAELYTNDCMKNTHSFILKTDCKTIFDEIKSWYEWTFILKK